MLYWMTAAASLLGVILNIRHDRRCFVLWLFSNVSWTIADFTHGLPSQAVLQAVYAGLSIYGLWRWRQRGTEPCTTNSLMPRSPR